MLHLFRLGFLMQVRLRVAIAVLSIAFALPTATFSIAYAIDVNARPSGAQYATAALGDFAAQLQLAEQKPMLPVALHLWREQQQRAAKLLSPDAVATFSQRNVPAKSQSAVTGVTLFARPWNSPTSVCGNCRVHAGRYPDAADEIALSPTSLQLLRVSIGEQVKMMDKQWTIVGVIQRDLDLKSPDAFVTAKSVAALGDWKLEMRWLLPAQLNGQVPSQFVYRSRERFENGLLGYSERLPAPLVFGALLFLIFCSAMQRQLSIRRIETRNQRLDGLGARRHDRIALAFGSAAAIALFGSLTAAAISTFVAFWVRQTVLDSGERVPAPFSLPTLPITLIWLLSIVALMSAHSLVARNVVRTTRSTRDRHFNNALTKFRNLSMATTRRSAGKWASSTLVLAAAILVLALEATSGATNYALATTRQSHLPNSIWVLRGDPTTTLGSDARLTNALRIAIQEATNKPAVFIYGLQVSVDDSAYYDATLCSRVQFERSCGLELLPDAAAFKVRFGRDWSVQERELLARGGVLYSGSGAVGQVHSAAIVLNTPKRPTALDALYEVLTMGPTAINLYPTYFVGPKFPQTLESRGLRATRYRSMILTSQNSVQSASELADLQGILDLHGMPIEALRTQQDPSSPVSEGLKMLMTLAVAVIAVLLGVRTVAGAQALRPQTQSLANIGATTGEILRLNVWYPTYVQGSLAGIGASLGALAYHAILPELAEAVGFKSSYVLAVIGLAGTFVAAVAALQLIAQSRQR